jgi:hypothetical protein
VIGFGGDPIKGGIKNVDTGAQRLEIYIQGDSHNYEME